MSELTDKRLFFFLNWIIGFFLPFLAFFDDALQTMQHDGANDLQLWVIVDLGYLFFDLIYCAPPGFRIFWFLSDGTRLAIACFLSLMAHGTYQYCIEGGHGESMRIVWFRELVWKYGNAIASFRDTYIFNK
jgi:hypothetical protein